VSVTAGIWFVNVRNTGNLNDSMRSFNQLLHTELIMYHNPVNKNTVVIEDVCRWFFFSESSA